ncbi:multidrug ABC transporter ATPase [Salmonella enterica subsp. enterica serovar Infantis]|uniref:Multidrug ABC transporter ATPase n=3 Tax=root TaxID=1 RepID=A0A5Y2LRW3_SALER|nr:multidrug ABC transporter ATPase [Salmonella enterica]EBH3545267.1 multidrug ABC transporter ATPase [Salmonella enterica subsp. enterica serovar Infantis]EBO2950159.1 multidrug ABC transporter ATPase [Salmonella enterica subsp. enterica serovar Newport]EBV6515828.1 multidrug ABC transporter ATPase [Salmonella enterica subsp. enterica serovar Emek]ECB7116672.1 multidrug ABC transporter ATPase [Salmonella enterica subsp. enterica serovar Typhimurium]ECD9356298.1 multidrug ABC transporter ATPa
MSFAFGLPLSGAMFSSRERLTKALKDNKDSYTISRDGHVSLNLNDAEVVKAIARQIEKLGDIKEESGKKG